MKNQIIAILFLALSTTTYTGEALADEMCPGDFGTSTGISCQRVPAVNDFHYFLHGSDTSHGDPNPDNQCRSCTIAKQRAYANSSDMDLAFAEWVEMCREFDGIPQRTSTSERCEIDIVPNIIRDWYAKYYYSEFWRCCGADGISKEPWE